MSDNSIPKPDIETDLGRAWFIAIPENPLPAWTASCATYLLESDLFHPAWSRWLVSIYHLREITGSKPALKRFPEATHEFSIISLDPNKYAEHFPLPPKNGWGFLEPLDVNEQLELPGDEYARQVCELATRGILSGHVSPDQDYRSVWRELLVGTAKHMREGRHAIH